ncbi:hypothetical protein [Nisaea sp.]|uniref:hypothetical protein n=1 Tax=Nisaea sp. TaxID=2024842 RepID=UPI00329A709B
MPINPPTALEIAALSAILPRWWAECQSNPTDAMLAYTYTRQEYEQFAGAILWAFYLGALAARG